MKQWNDKPGRGYYSSGRQCPRRITLSFSLEITEQIDRKRGNTPPLEWIESLIQSAPEVSE